MTLSEAKAMRSFANAGKKLSDPMKGAITGYNPVFAISNAFRDIPTLYLQSNYNPFKTTSNIVKAIKEMATNGDMYSQYLGLGGKSSGYFNQGKG